MRIKLLVQTQTHETWPARGERLAGESYNLQCFDMSQPASERMVEPVTYRLKPDEIPAFWDKAMDSTIDVVCRRIAHNKAGKAQIVGEIIMPPALKK
jgi:hypothetical protein